MSKLFDKNRLRQKQKINKSLSLVTVPIFCLFSDSTDWANSEASLLFKRFLSSKIDESSTEIGVSGLSLSGQQVPLNNLKTSSLPAFLLNLTMQVVGTIEFHSLVLNPIVGKWLSSPNDSSLILRLSFKKGLLKFVSLMTYPKNSY